MYSKILASMLVVLGLLGMGSACEDPGDPNGGGKVQHPIVILTDGMTISKKSYGLWKAEDAAPTNCHWNVTIHGKNVSSGEKTDAIIAGSGLRGGLLHTNCGKFYKEFSH